MPIVRFLNRLFFAPHSPVGFGLMRAAWGAVVLLSVCVLIPDRAAFFTDNGLLTPDLRTGLLRTFARFSLLDLLPGEAGVDLFFVVLLLAAASTALGVLPRVSTVVCTLLLWSLHERNPFVFAGGDTVLRLLGFLLCVAPSVDAFSLRRARATLRGRTTGPLPDVPAYAYRLLLWQIIVLYGLSLTEKLQGTMWIAGTAVEAVLHHPVFTRAPLWAVQLLNPVSPLVTWGTLGFHALWLLLLVPREVMDLLPRWVPRIRMKRLCIALGMAFHGSIFLLIDAGDFSLVMLTAYLGLLDAEDLAMFRTLWNWRWRGTVAVLYDGACGFCTGSIRFLELCDWGNRLRADPFQNAAVRAARAPTIPPATLARSLHIVLPNGRILAGFAAFRELCEHLPPLLPFVPLLWLPGMETLGTAVYDAVAKRRRCIAGNCKT